MHSSPHVIVTGGAGFIGSHLVERLLREGRRVTVIDDFSTGRRENLLGVERDPRLRIIQSRVSECTELTELARGAEALFHLAAAVGVELVMKSQIHTIRTNLHETEHVLEAAAAARVPVLLASTSEVYGKSSKAVFSEDDDLLIGPPHLSRWSYACSKLMDEFLALAYARERGVSVVIVRLFNTVGPRQTGRYGMVLPRFVEAAKKNEPLRVFGTGEQTRCFCYVGDTVEALLRLQRSPSAFGEIFNVGTDQEISIGDLARRVIEWIGSESKIERIPYSEAYGDGFEDMVRRRPNLEKLRRVTGFTAGTRLPEIIRVIAGK